MGHRQAAFLLLIGLCQCGPNRHALYQRLPEADKQLFANTRQFMTERQELKFLSAKSSKERVRFVEGLQIHDRLRKFAGHEREAILAQRIVPGMNAEAVMLSWGRPEQIDRRQQDGVPLEQWLYHRGAPDGRVREYRVLFVKGLVTEVGTR